MRIAVASGKGGTGKTLVSTALARTLAQRGGPVTYVDADVEEPNGHLLLAPVIEHEERFSVPVVAPVSAVCAGCGDCQKACAFNAILAAGRMVMVFEELCHGCGVCLEVCTESALEERAREAGTIRHGHVGDLAAGGLRFVSGTSDVGVARTAPLVDETVFAAPPRGTVVVDCPPGTSCNAVAAMRGADVAVLVTEPTPFGLHDLGRAAELCRRLDIPCVVLMNRAGVAGPRGAELFERWNEEALLPVVAEVPFERSLAAAYASGEDPLGASPALRRAIESLADWVGQRSAE